MTISIQELDAQTQQVEVSIPISGQRRFMRLVGYDHRNLDVQAAIY